jgi:hypothetical protein
MVGDWITPKAGGADARFLVVAVDEEYFYWRLDGVIVPGPGILRLDSRQGYRAEHAQAWFYQLTKAADAKSVAERYGLSVEAVQAAFAI